ncbi:cyclic nucleotide-binding domain-containing protein [Pleurocapsales cyanobacterium LEGE 10410]|nr:cyclic nucleotide-binding domain-containing protein [Pleurocapsales cyanobacterium LEGE 10410]
MASISIRRTIHLLIIAPLISVMGLTSAIIFIAGREIVSHVGEDLSTEVSEHIVEHTQNYLDLPHLVLQNMAIAKASGAIDFNDFASLEKYMWQLVTKNDALQYVFYGDEERRFLGVQQSNSQDKFYVKVKEEQNAERKTYLLDERGNRADLVVSSEYSTLTRPWYQAAKRVQQPTWSEIYPASSSSILSISPIVPVYDRGENLQGVLSIQISLNEISNFLQEIKHSRSMEALIIDRQGQIIATSTAESLATPTEGGSRRLKAIDSREPIVKATVRQTLEQYNNFEQIDNKTFFTFDFANKRQLVQIVPLKNRQNLDWLVAVVIPEANFMAPVYRYITLVVIVGIGVAVLAIFIALKISGWIVEPINVFDRAATDIEQQTFEPASLDAIAERQDEFGQLGRVFQLMATVVYQRESSLQQQVAQLRQEQQKTNESALMTHFKLDRWQKLIARSQQLRGIRLPQGNDTDFLGRVPLFQDLDREDLAELFDASDRRDLGKGEYIFQENEPADCFYIILSGAIEIIHQSESKAILNYGEIFGEISFLFDTPRLVTAKAVESIQLLTINRQQLAQLLNKYPDLLEHLERNLDEDKLNLGNLKQLLRKQQLAKLSISK